MVVGEGGMGEVYQILRSGIMSANSHKSRGGIMPGRFTVVAVLLTLSTSPAASQDRSATATEKAATIPEASRRTPGR